MLLVTVVCMLVLKLSGLHPLPVRHWLGVTWSQRRWLLLRGACGTATVGLNIASLGFLDIADANALNFTWPVFGFILSWALLGESASIRELIGLCGAVVGSILVARPPFIFGAVGAVPISGAGLAIALTGASTMGATVVMIRMLAGKLHWTVVIVYQCLGQVLFAPIAMAVLNSTPIFSGPIFGYAFATGCLASAHQILLTKGLAKARVGPSAAMQSTFPLASFLLQKFVTPEDELEPLSMAGALVIVVSVVVILVSKRQAAPAAASKHLVGAVHSSEDPAWVTATPQSELQMQSQPQATNQVGILTREIATPHRVGIQ